MTKIKSEAERVRKKRRVLFLTPLVIIGVLVAIFLPRYLYEHRTINGIPEPVQVDMADIVARVKDGEKIETEKTITGNGFRVKMEYLATYDIKGLVVTLDDYDTKRGATAFDLAIPRDLSIVWGYSAINADKIKYGHSERALNYKYSSGLDRQKVIASTSNNHIIVEEGELRQRLKKVRKGDYIEMKGYLVAGEIDDGNGGEKLSFHSSTVRTDHVERPFDMKTSCEIIYLTDLEWLD